MLRPTESDRPKKAPLFAASMTPGPPPEMTREAGVRQLTGDLLGELVVWVVGRRAGAAEDRDRGPDRAQAFGRLDEL